ncbi:DUF6894 family protein [Methylorubrum suomiense]|uniref:DUF6894 domain-containing protein n=1 Tax=Methylorubrum suomiense TaxID=144191 RepID=A0ABQ4UPV7_9HYPH|nr:hypothetical protein [Methylorubrum suomiense]GJE74220.1 hypothetical protein BGCPKDLD_0789 [Methylorubrum suomiense]
MPVFFFDVCARGRLEADEAGLELANAEAAYLEACAAIPGLTAELLRAGDEPRGCAFVVANEARRILFGVPFHESQGGPSPKVPPLPTAWSTLTPTCVPSRLETSTTTGAPQAAMRSRSMPTLSSASANDVKPAWRKTLPEASTAMTANRPSGMPTMRHSTGLAMTRGSSAQVVRRRVLAATNSR